MKLSTYWLCVTLYCDILAMFFIRIDYIFVLICFALTFYCFVISLLLRSCEE